VLCYITVAGGQRTDEYAARFVQTYQQNAAGYPHATIIVSNGGPLSDVCRFLFTGFPGLSVWERPNDPGWDLSAYREVAASIGTVPTNFMLVCFGESIHFHRPGWLLKLVGAWNTYGPGMYGAFASHTIRAHINTTGFAIEPSLFSYWPEPFQVRQDRYEFEHGDRALWRRLSEKRIPVMLVTWDGVWPSMAWRYAPNILWRGNQRNCLFFCQHTDNYFASTKERRARWERMVDAPYR